ncbi:MAG: Gfo/Idh/MocA family oxidoreductase [Hyphomicrobiaceae bacterium]|nr:Gfo/Idh/MocA family oxidoreductase [Hyphomicrobiaceae bacterium]
MFRIGVAGLDGSHAGDFLRLFHSGGKFAGFRTTAIWGTDAARAAELATFSGEVDIKQSLGELIAEVDGVLICDRHGDLHVPTALAVIASGKPVFVDKPLALQFADAERVTEAAAKAGVALLSGSALRWQKDTLEARRRIQTLLEPHELLAYGTWFPDNPYGGMLYYAIHAIELLLAVAGPDFSDLEFDAGSTAEEPRFTLRQGARRHGLMLRKPDANGETAFGLEVRKAGTVENLPVVLSDDYMADVAAEVVAMFMSGRSPLPAETMLASIRMGNEMDAAFASRG